MSLRRALSALLFPCFAVLVVCLGLGFAPSRSGLFD